MTLLAKFQGAMIGTAVGDSLGAPFEGRGHVTREEVYASAERREIMNYTDDTHMMIGVAESLIERKGFDGDHMASRFIDNFMKEPFRGYGPGPPNVFAMIESGVRWDKASEKLYPGGSYGNGAAMRIAPIGLFYYDNPNTLRQVACESSHITHAHVMGKEGAAIEAYAIALATDLNSSLPFDRDTFLKKLRDFTGHPAYNQKLQKMTALTVDLSTSRVASELGNTIEAFNSVPASIFSFMSFAQSFEAAVVHAIILGGDTDTIGAMTGAISGAYLGIDAIPQQWRGKLENSAYLERLAYKLWQVKT